MAGKAPGMVPHPPALPTSHTDLAHDLIQFGGFLSAFGLVRIRLGLTHLHQLGIGVV